MGSSDLLARMGRRGAPVLAGIVVGMGIALAVAAPRGGVETSRTNSSPAHTSEIASARSPSAETATDPVVNQRIEALERRIEELSRARVDSQVPPSPAVDFENDRETRKQRAFAEQTELLARHRSEARDPAWASHHERQVRAALGDLSETMKHSFALQSVDCRTASCVAQLTWPNEAAARMDAESFMGGSAAVRCARRMTFPPADGAGPYTASLYLDCAEFRWGQSPGNRG